MYKWLAMLQFSYIDASAVWMIFTVVFFLYTCRFLYMKSGAMGGIIFLDP